jgi:hypothetical protein
LSLYVPLSVDGDELECVGGPKLGSTVPVQGLWELPMTGEGRLEIEHRYNVACGLESFPIPEWTGATVTRGDITCELPFDLGPLGSARRATSTLPSGSTVAVSTEALRNFQKSGRTTPNAETLGKTREAVEVPTKVKDTLLTMIAGLSDLAGLDRQRPSKSAGLVVNATEQLGISVGRSTVENYLKEAWTLAAKRE